MTARRAHFEEDELDQRLSESGKVQDVTRLQLARFRDATWTRTRARRRLRLSWIGGASALALLGAIVAAPAAADQVRRFLADTGQTCQGSECGGPSKAVDLKAPDVSKYIASRFPDYVPVPPGSTRADVEREVQAQFPEQPKDGRSYVTVDTAVTAVYENVAYCGWVGSWLDADKRGDAKTRASATQVLVAAGSWPNVAQAGDLQRLQVAFVKAAKNGERDGVDMAAMMYHCKAAGGEYHADWMRANGLIE